jgi:hypothetical protein
VTASFPQVHDPYRCINNNHGQDFVGLRLRMERRPFSVPPSLAKRLLLSRAIRASSPRRTSAVFSLTPVKREALCNISSSMFKVVLMHINMHYLCTYVNQTTTLPHITSLFDVSGSDSSLL